MVTRKRRKHTDKEVPVNGTGAAFVADKSGVHGTPSNTERKGARGAYAASSVIERGTANRMRATMGDQDEREPCLCGCGVTPSQVDSLFMPGHDSKVRSIGKALLEGRIKRADVYGPALKYLDEGGMTSHG